MKMAKALSVLAFCWYAHFLLDWEVVRPFQQQSRLRPPTSRTTVGLPLLSLLLRLVSARLSSRQYRPWC
ncbi:hypothetical protein VTN96DRAFT_7557 [Rasamsonia emersonii]